MDANDMCQCRNTPFDDTDESELRKWTSPCIQIILLGLDGELYAALIKRFPDKLDRARVLALGALALDKYTRGDQVEEAVVADIYSVWYDAKALVKKLCRVAMRIELEDDALRPDALERIARIDAHADSCYAAE